MHVYNNKLCNHNNLKTLDVKVDKLISIDKHIKSKCKSLKFHIILFIQNTLSPSQSASSSTKILELYDQSKTYNNNSLNSLKYINKNLAIPT